MWSHTTLEIPYDGPFQIAFEARLMDQDNEIALDDITLSGVLEAEKATADEPIEDSASSKLTSIDLTDTTKSAGFDSTSLTNNKTEIISTLAPDLNVQETVSIDKTETTISDNLPMKDTIITNSSDANNTDSSLGQGDIISNSTSSSISINDTLNGNGTIITNTINSFDETTITKISSDSFTTLESTDLDFKFTTFTPDFITDKNETIKLNSSDNSSNNSKFNVTETISDTATTEAQIFFNVSTNVSDIESDDSKTSNISDISNVSISSTLVPDSTDSNLTSDLSTEPQPSKNGEE